MIEKLRYMGQWMMYRGYIILPTLYVMYLLLLEESISIRMFVFYVILGLFVRYGYIAWKRHDLDDDAVDFDFISKEYDDTKRKSFKEYVLEMPYWERMHWIPILVFLGLTCYVMVKGLQLLFVPSPATDIFIYIFSGCITFTLFWLVLMISNRRNMVGFIIFYLLFDLMSAFSFNFVHFYDNVSGTQRRDADMKACRMYQDIQAKNVRYITEKATIEKAQAMAFEKQKADNLALLEKQIANQRWAMRNSGSYEGKQKDRELLNSLQERRNALINKNTNADMMLFTNAAYLDSIGQVLNKMCLKYEDNSSEVTNEEVQEAKRQVQAMQIVVEQLERNGKLGTEFIVRNDTITYILRKIEAKGTDHFASLKSLFSAFFPNEKTEAQLRAEYCAGGGKALGRFYDEEKSFENRLLYLSIALSSLIDLLPLFLGIFVSITKKKEREA